MKRHFIVISTTILITLITLFLQEKTTSRYKKGISVNVHDKTGNLVCNASLDNPGTYVSEDGWAYFKVIVKNFDDDKTSQVPLEFNLEIGNATGSNAYYRYSIDEDISSFDTSLTTNNYRLSAGSQQTKEIMIEVKTDSTASEDVDFSVDVNCYQVTK